MNFQRNKRMPKHIAFVIIVLTICSVLSCIIGIDRLVNLTKSRAIKIEETSKSVDSFRRDIISNSPLRDIQDSDIKGGPNDWRHDYLKIMKSPQYMSMTEKQLDYEEDLKNSVGLVYGLGIICCIILVIGVFRVFLNLNNGRLAFWSSILHIPYLLMTLYVEYKAGKDSMEIAFKWLPDLRKSFDLYEVSNPSIAALIKFNFYEECLPILILTLVFLPCCCTYALFFRRRHIDLKSKIKDKGK